MCLVILDDYSQYGTTLPTKKYTAIYEYGDDGLWKVHIKEIRGVHTQGRNIAQARRRVREALSLFVDDADTAELVDDLRLGPDLRGALRKMVSARRAAARLCSSCERSAAIQWRGNQLPPAERVV